MAQNGGDYEQAGEYYRESLALFRELDARYGIAHSLSSQGELALIQGDYSDARRLFAEALTRFGELGSTKEMGAALARFAILAAAQGRDARRQGFSARQKLSA